MIKYAEQYWTKTYELFSLVFTLAFEGTVSIRVDYIDSGLYVALQALAKRNGS